MYLQVINRERLLYIRKLEGVHKLQLNAAAKLETLKHDVGALIGRVRRQNDGVRPLSYAEVVALVDQIGEADYKAVVVLREFERALNFYKSTKDLFEASGKKITAAVDAARAQLEKHVRAIEKRAAEGATALETINAKAEIVPEVMTVEEIEAAILVSRARKGENMIRIGFLMSRRPAAVQQYLKKKIAGHKMVSLQSFTVAGIVEHTKLDDTGESSVEDEGSSYVGIVPDVTSMGSNLLTDALYNADEKVQLLAPVNVDETVNIQRVSKGTYNTKEVRRVGVKVVNNRRARVGALSRLIKINFDTNFKNIVTGAIWNGVIVFRGKLYIRSTDREFNRTCLIEYGAFDPQNGCNAVLTGEKMENVMAHGRHFEFLVAGPSNLRTASAFFVQVDSNATEDEVNAYCGGLLDILSNGCYTKYLMTAMQPSKVTKKSARITLGMASQEPIAHLRSIAIINIEPQTKEGYCYNDGNALFRASWMQGELKRNLGVEVSLEDTFKLAMQGRQQAPIAKYFALAGTDRQIYTKVYENHFVGFDAALPVVKYETDEELKFFQDHCDDEDMQGKTFILGECEDGIPDIVLDRNSFKAMSNILNKDAWTFNALDIAQASAAHTNSQFIASYSLVPGFVEWLEGYAKKCVETAIAGGFDVAQVINPDNYFDSILMGVCPEFALQDRTIFDAVKEGVVNSVSNMIRDSKYPINGAYLRGTGDMALDFGLHILCKHEIYAPVLGDGVEADVLRNPHMGSGEHYNAITVSLKTVLRRVATAIKDEIITVSQGNAILDFYQNISSGVVVTPGYQEFATATGGSDFDFDGFTCITDEDWVRFSKTVPMTAINFDAVKDSRAKVMFGMAAIKASFLEQVIGSVDGQGITPEGIEVLSIRNKNIVCMLGTKADVFADCKKKLEKDMDCGPVMDHAEAYIRHFGHSKNGIDVINDADAKAIRADYISSDRSLESFKNFLLDASDAYCSIGGRGIDRAKTGEIVWTYLLAELNRKDVDGKFDKRMKGNRSKFNAKNYLDVNYETSEVELCKDADFYSSQTPSFDCYLEDMRQNVFDFAVEQLNAITPFELDEREAENLENVGESSVMADKYDVELLKRMSNGISNCRLADSREKVEVRTAIANMLRQAFAANATDIDKYLVLRKASKLHEQPDDDTTRFGSFYKTLQPEVLRAFVTAADSMGYSVNRVAGYSVRFMFGFDGVEGQVCNFVDGIDLEHGVVAETRYNGTLTLKDVGGRFYGVKDIFDFFPEVGVSNDVVLELSNDVKPEIVSAIKASGYIRVRTEGRNEIYYDGVAEHAVDLVTSKTLKRNDHVRVNNTRLTTALNGIGVRISEIFRMEDVGDRHIKTFILGEAIKVDKPLPAAKKTGSVVLQKPVQTDNLPSFDEICGMFN